MSERIFITSYDSDDSGYESDEVPLTKGFPSERALAVQPKRAPVPPVQCGPTTDYNSDDSGYESDYE